MVALTRRLFAALVLPLASLAGCAATDIPLKEPLSSEMAVLRLFPRPNAAGAGVFPRARIFRAMGVAAPGSTLPLAVPAGPIDVVVRCEVQLGTPGSETERFFTPEGGPGGFAYIDVERRFVVEAGRSYEPNCFKVDGGMNARLIEVLPGS